MIVPSRRWYLVAAALAVLALAGWRWPAAFDLLVAADAGWLLLLVIDGLLLAPRPFDAVSVEREAPPAFSVGRALPVRYRWDNRTPREVTLRVREVLPNHLRREGGTDRTLVLPSASSRWEEATIIPTRRGKQEGGPMYLRLLGPLGLAWRQGAHVLPWTALVFPNLEAMTLRSLTPPSQRRREVGLRAVRHLGEGRVFESLREWLPGDDTRIIDWKATARRGKVMARQYEDERRQQVLIAVDASRMLTAEVDGVPRLEAVVDAALHLAHSVVEHDDNVGLMVFADQVQYFVPPARGRRALRAILEGLATAEGRLVEANYPAAFSSLAVRNRKRALTVVFTDVIDRTASDALVTQLGSLRPRHLPLTVTLRDTALERLATAEPEDNRQAFERAAAEELLQAREAALSEMRRRGVLVLDVPPHAASRAVVDRYNQLKRRGMV